jgi:NAD(P)-dependent dehydrogenase (short-subunit alcohol dehydrogenase family)
MPSLTGNSFDPNKDIPDLSGKVYVITGGTAGIGFGITAHVLQHNPAKVYILSKKEEHADEAQQELQKYGDVSKVEWMKCDLEDLKQTDEVAKELKQKLDRLDAVCRFKTIIVLPDSHKP